MSSNSSSSLQIDSWSHSRVRSPSLVQPSSSSVIVASRDSHSLLDTVPVSYSTRTSCCGRSPSVAPSCTRSPVSEGCYSRLRSCSRADWSPSAGSSEGGVTQGVLSAVEVVLVSLQGRLLGAGLLLLTEISLILGSRLPSPSQRADEDRQEE